MMWPNKETITICLIFYRQYFREEIKEIMILCAIIHLGCIILNLLLVVDTTLNAQVVFLIGVVTLQIFSNCSLYDIVSCGLNSQFN